MNYYDEIKRKLIDNEIYSKVKDYSKEMNKINTYFEIGKLLNEVGKKYNRSTLFRMKQFYNVFNNEKVAPVVRQLSWSHCLILLPLKDINKINYYINQISNRNLSKRQLQDIIKSKEYERLPINTKNKLINKEKINAIDLVKNPIHIKNSKNKEIISEKILQKLILEDISTFLKELGNGFTFIDNEYKIKLDDRYNYIDLLLYNIKHKCYVVVELKVTELRKEHTGQIMTYMNYIDKNIKTFEENKTVGIIICKKNNDYVIEFCSDSRIIAREYEMV